MPIHLLPVDRRRFLTGTASAVAAAACRLGFASEREEDEWVLLSDVHISGDLKTSRLGVRMADRFAEAAEMVRRISPSRILIDGDCAYLYGEPKDYRGLADILGKLEAAGAPIHATLGNHDDRDAFSAGIGDRLAGEKSPLTTNRVSVLETPRANWFLLDSLGKVGQTPGILGETQRKWLARELDARADKPAVIVAHHNLSAVEDVRRDARTIVPCADRLLGVPGLSDTRLLLDVLVPREHVVAYLCGHTHQWNVREYRGIALVNLPTTVWTFLPADPTGFVRCRIGEEGMRFELVCFDPKHPSHGQHCLIGWKRTMVGDRAG